MIKKRNHVLSKVAWRNISYSLNTNGNIYFSVRDIAQKHARVVANKDEAHFPQSPKEWQ